MEQDHTGRGGGRHRTHLGATAMCRGWQLRHAGGGGEELPKERETLEREMRNVEEISKRLDGLSRGPTRNKEHELPARILPWEPKPTIDAVGCTNQQIYSLM
jgi:hypothetical protein